jgi:hypothetical protein
MFRKNIGADLESMFYISHQVDLSEYSDCSVQHDHTQSKGEINSPQVIRRRED